MARVLGIRLRVADLIAHRVALVVAGKNGDVAVEGGGVEQGLTVARDAVEQAPYLGQEAHVRHAVGFVDKRRLRLR